MIVTPDRLAARRGELVSILEEEGLDGLLVTHPPNIRYLTGFTGSAGILVISSEETKIFTDPRYRTQVELEMGGAVAVEIVPGDLWQRVWEALGGWSTLDSLAYESHRVSVQQAKKLAEADFGDIIRPVDSLVERLRLCKSPDEVRAIGDAARMAAEALERALPQVKAGMTELRIAGLLERELRAGGSERHPFPTIAASGPNSALPHAATGSREIEAGDLLLLDFGAQVDGYCSDITRTVVVGRSADERQRNIYELVRDAQRAACQGIRVGMSGREADALARARIADAGFGDAFEHSLGHGLGLEVHEEPRLSKSNEDPLPEGAVVTVEPGVYLREWGGIRIEDDVFLSEDGPVLLSDGDNELREIT